MQVSQAMMIKPLFMLDLFVALLPAKFVQTILNIMYSLMS